MPWTRQVPLIKAAVSGERNGGHNQKDITEELRRSTSKWGELRRCTSRGGVSSGEPMGRLQRGDTAGGKQREKENVTSMVGKWKQCLYFVCI